MIYSYVSIYFCSAYKQSKSDEVIVLLSNNTGSKKFKFMLKYL